MKMTPKSCSCTACKRGKASKSQKLYMKKHERAFRHSNKIALNKGNEDFIIAPHSNYTD